MKEVAAFVLFLALLVLVSDAKVTKPNTGNFLRCLSNGTGPVHPITDVLLTPANSTFVSSYVSYTKNKRLSNPKDTNLIAIIAAKHGSHVQATVVCAKFDGIQIRIRSGGHDYEGLSYISSVPFVILDMHNLRSIVVDVSSKTAWVEAELPWEKICFGRFVAVAVPAFGVILSWKINLVEVPKTLTVFKVNKTLEQGATDVLYKWQLVASKLPKELFLRAMPQITKGAKSGEKTLRLSSTLSS
ncbi:unnamed protein product [Microthlaspi erraticum]|uniref:FAD linked oxidase N-terminal domain-containing protein n=1 Tax=Microthlaspi erraticum TaxID=1685480 RepID=A0A6D2KRE1_9BRAS|nr:unnamed protein product [Microthlaspi erraticum]